MQISDATAIAQGDLCAAMNQSFSDYAVPMQLTQARFALLMQQRGLDPAASRIALLDGQIAAIWLVGTRADAAYLISSGTLPAHRRKGLARALAQASIAGLRQSGLRRLQTEVLCSNTGAHDLYASLGMTRTRVLDCYDVPPLPSPAVNHRIETRPWSALRDAVAGFGDMRPSWQNSSAAIDAIEGQVHCWAAMVQDKLAGYAVVLPDGATLAQIAVRPNMQRRGIATALIAAAHPGKALRVINADAGHDPFRRLMARLGAKPTLSQYELAMDLS